MAVAAQHEPRFAATRCMKRLQNALEDVLAFRSPARLGFNGADAHR
jgi:hypothetical protein